MLVRGAVVLVAELLDAWLNMDWFGDHVDLISLWLSDTACTEAVAGSMRNLVISTALACWYKNSFSCFVWTVQGRPCSLSRGTSYHVMQLAGRTCGAHVYTPGLRSGSCRVRLGHTEKFTQAAPVDSGQHLFLCIFAVSCTMYGAMYDSKHQFLIPVIILVIFSLLRITSLASPDVWAALKACLWRCVSTCSNTSLEWTWIFTCLMHSYPRFGLLRNRGKHTSLPVISHSNRTCVGEMSSYSNTTTFNSPAKCKADNISYSVQ